MKLSKRFTASLEQSPAKGGWTYVVMPGAANYSPRRSSARLLDGTHPNDTWYKIPLLPLPGAQNDAIEASAGGGYLWWFAFNQLRALPEQFLAGR
jgi:hypothetical protein